MEKKFTPYQIDEIVPLIDIRLETIEDDPDSADEFETPESLTTLKNKIESGNMEFTEPEKKFLIEELECRKEVGYGNQSNEGIKIFGFINSLSRAITLIKSL